MYGLIGSFPIRKNMAGFLKLVTHMKYLQPRAIFQVLLQSFMIQQHAM